MLRTMKLPLPETHFSDILLFSDDYEVKVNGEDCQVRACRVSAMPFNRIWPGKQRPVNQTEIASFVSFSSDETATLQVKCKKIFNNAVIRPLSKNIHVERNEDVVEFTLKKCGQYVLELDDTHFALHIFFNPVREYSDAEKEAATYYFGPGLHFVHRINLKDNESLYVDENAVVFTSVFAKGAKNIRIYGGGVLDDSCEERITESYYDYGTIGNIRLYDCENVRIEDVILKDSAIFAFSTYDCNDIEVDNIKIIGQWRYNTDGIDPVNTSNMVIKNSFIRSFDDAISIKGIRGKDISIENITVENCIAWCDWGTSFRLGESYVREYQNIVFRNCDIIHHGFTAFDMINFGQAEIHHITYENINVEFQKSTPCHALQHTDDEVFDTTGKKAAMGLINIENDRSGVVSYDRLYGQLFRECKNKKDSSVHDILYKNIHIYLEEGMRYPDIRIYSVHDDIIHKDFLIEGLYVNGVKETDIDKFRPMIKNASNVKLV